MDHTPKNVFVCNEEDSESNEEKPTRNQRLLEETIRMREAMKQAALEGKYGYEIHLSKKGGYDEITRCVQELYSWFREDNEWNDESLIEASVNSYLEDIGKKFDLVINVRGNHDMHEDGQQRLILEWYLGLNLNGKHDKPHNKIGCDLFKLAFPVALGIQIKEDMNGVGSKLYLEMRIKEAQGENLVGFSYFPYDKNPWMPNEEFSSFLVPGIDEKLYGFRARFYKPRDTNSILKGLNIQFIRKPNPKGAPRKKFATNRTSSTNKRTFKINPPKKETSFWYTSDSPPRTRRNRIEFLKEALNRRV